MKRLYSVFEKQDGKWVRTEASGRELKSQMRKIAVRGECRKNNP